MSKIYLIDAATGKEVLRDMTAEELADYELVKADVETLEAEVRAKATAKAELLERLGITEDEAKLLLS